MGVIKQMLSKNIKKAEIEDFIREKTRDAVFGGVEIAFTPIGTRVTIYAMKPARVIGSRGRTIKEISRTLEERFKLENPQVTVAEIEVPELNPYVMAARIASAMERGVRFRRVAFWALKRVIDAGARGVEINIGGKITSARSRREKFRDGSMPKAGEAAMKFINSASVSVQLKTGLFGVTVSIYPPEAPMPESVTVSKKAEETLVQSVEESTSSD